MDGKFGQVAQALGNGGELNNRIIMAGEQEIVDPYFSPSPARECGQIFFEQGPESLHIRSVRDEATMGSGGSGMQGKHQAVVRQEQKVPQNRQRAAGSRQ